MDNSTDAHNKPSQQPDGNVRSGSKRATRLGSRRKASSESVRDKPELPEALGDAAGALIAIGQALSLFAQVIGKKGRPGE